jgi:hypothetical protein
MKGGLIANLHAVKALTKKAFGSSTYILEGLFP